MHGRPGARARVGNLIRRARPWSIVGMTYHDPRPPLSVVKLPLRNRLDHAVELRIEPWGERYRLSPGACLEVIGRGPEGDTVEIQWEGDVVTVFAWPGATVAVLSNGVDIGAA